MKRLWFAIPIAIIGAIVIYTGPMLLGGFILAFGILFILLVFVERKHPPKDFKEAYEAKYGKKKEEREAAPAKSVSHPQPGVTIEVTMGEEQLQEFSVKGINFAGLTDTLLGNHVGHVRALKSNEHDPYAIGVYVGNKRIGHLPRGNKELHARITEEGGSVDAYIYIGKMRDENDGHYFYYGKVKPII